MTAQITEPYIKSMYGSDRSNMHASTKSVEILQDFIFLDFQEVVVIASKCKYKNWEQERTHFRRQCMEKVFFYYFFYYFLKS